MTEKDAAIAVLGPVGFRLMIFCNGLFFMSFI